MGELLKDLIHDDLNFQNGFYIEAGANNGIRQSNTLFLERSLNWSGILIEPNANKMNLCKQYRSPKNIFYNCAISSDENITELYGNFDEDDPGESLAACSSSIIELDYHDEEFKSAMKEKIKSKHQISVSAKTLNSILNENKITHIDFMSLDLEGYELEAIKNLNFNKFNITYILIETANRPKYQKIVKEFMLKNEYVYYEKISNNDDLFKRI